MSDSERTLKTMPPSADWKLYTAASSPVASGNPLVRMAADCVAARSLAWRLFVRDLSAYYRQSLLGYAWAFVPPVVLTLSFTLAGEAAILNTSATPVPYPVFALVGMVLWQTFAEAVKGPVTAVSQAKPLLARIRFPYEAIVLAKLGEQIFNLAIRLVLVALTLLYYQIDVSGMLPLAVFPLCMLVLLGTALGLMLATLGSLYDDVSWSLTLVLSLWFLLTPVMYAEPTPGSFFAWANLVNPVTPVLVTARELLTTGSASGWLACLLVGGVTAPLLVVGWVFYRSSLAFAIERISA